MYENYEPEGFQYAIQPEDCLCDIADDFGLAEEEIIAANPEVDFEALQVGQEISIPDLELEQRPVPPPGMMVRPGFDQRDRFDRFDRFDQRDRFDRFGRRRRAFCRRGDEYYVRPGDTLYRIARRFNVPVREIMFRNRHINFNYPLNVGDVLCIPI